MPHLSSSSQSCCDDYEPGTVPCAEAGVLRDGDTAVVRQTGPCRLAQKGVVWKMRSRARSTVNFKHTWETIPIKVGSQCMACWAESQQLEPSLFSQACSSTTHLLGKHAAAKSTYLHLTLVLRRGSKASGRDPALLCFQLNLGTAHCKAQAKRHGLLTLATNSDACSH